MKSSSLLSLALLAFMLFGAAGCGGDDVAAKPKIVKGGLDTEKAKAEKNVKVGTIN